MVAYSAEGAADQRPELVGAAAPVVVPSFALAPGATAPTPRQTGLTGSVLRGATVLYGLLGTAAALAMLRVENALDAWWKISSIFSGGILGLFLLGLIVRRARNAAAATAVCVGVLVIFWLSAADQGWLPEALRPALHANLTIVVGTLSIFLVGLLASRIQKPS